MLTMSRSAWTDTQAERVIFCQGIIAGVLSCADGMGTSMVLVTVDGEGRGIPSSIIPCR